MEKDFDINNPQEWEKLYIDGNTGWDLGGPTPVFVDIAENLRPAKICILGCGHGYDAVMFSEKGFNVTAIDFAPAPIKYINKKAAELSGINIRWIEMSVYMISGLFAAISAVMIVGWMGSVTNALGYTYELRVIAATVIGGANLMGGVGGTFGAFIGAALMETIRNSLLMAGIDPYWQGTFLGLFIVGAVWLEIVKNKKN